VSAGKEEESSEAQRRREDGAVVVVGVSLEAEQESSGFLSLWDASRIISSQRTGETLDEEHGEAVQREWGGGGDGSALRPRRNKRMFLRSS
jgi:hypothetical protein